MSYEFTQAEKDGLAALQSQIADSNDSYYGQYWRLYDYILDIVTEIDPGTGSESPIEGVSQSTWL